MNSIPKSVDGCKRKPSFSFKKSDPVTGLARIGHQRTTYIKNSGEWVGSIYPPGRRSLGERSFTISFMVVQEEHPGWRWSRLTKRFDNDDDARIWIKENAKSIVTQLSLHGMQMP